MDESADFGDTLDSLATFGASIANTIVVAERGGTVVPSVVPRTNLPQGSSTVIQPSRQTTGVTGTEIALLVGVGLALAFGIRAFSRA
jgi:hypothetical protein